MIEINLLTLDTTGIILLSVFGVAVLLVIIIVALFLFNKINGKKNTTKKENTIVAQHSDDKFIEALGGSDNLVSYELKGQSRLSLVLRDYTKINKEELKKFYISRFLEMSDKIILVGENLKPLLDILNNIKRN